ncbi:MAG: hypothetical protein R2723_03900 [Microbacterium sp.]
MAQTGRAGDAAALAADAWEARADRRDRSSRRHRTFYATQARPCEATLAFARLKPGVDFGAGGGPADRLPHRRARRTAAEEHLAVLSRLARAFMREDFTAGLRAASTPADVVALGKAAVSDNRPPHAAAVAAAAVAPATALVVDGRPARIVAVTACATGIAHTFMAADALTAAGQQAGVDLVVEPQGSSGYKPLPQSVIDDADAVIFAVDVDVRDSAQQLRRQAGRARARQKGIEQPAALIDEAASPRSATPSRPARDVSAPTPPRRHAPRRRRRRRQRDQAVAAADRCQLR